MNILGRSLTYRGDPFGQRLQLRLSSIEGRKFCFQDGDKNRQHILGRAAAVFGVLTQRQAAQSNPGSHGLAGKDSACGIGDFCGAIVSAKAAIGMWR